MRQCRRPGIPQPTGPAPDYNLRERRIALGLTQAVVAEALDRKPPAISMAESLRGRGLVDLCHRYNAWLAEQETNHHGTA